MCFIQVLCFVSFVNRENWWTLNMLHRKHYFVSSLYFLLLSLNLSLILSIWFLLFSVQYKDKMECNHTAILMRCWCKSSLQQELFWYLETPLLNSDPLQLSESLCRSSAHTLHGGSLHSWPHYRGHERPIRKTDLFPESGTAYLLTGTRCLSCKNHALEIKAIFSKIKTNLILIFRVAISFMSMFMETHSYIFLENIYFILKIFKNIWRVCSVQCYGFALRKKWLTLFLSLFKGHFITITKCWWISMWKVDFLLH